MCLLCSLTFFTSHLSDIGRDVSVTLPAASTSYQVTGLRLGRQYRFTVRPTFANGFGGESFVDERTGEAPTPSCALQGYNHLVIPCFALLVHSVCGWPSGCGVSGAGIY